MVKVLYCIVNAMQEQQSTSQSTQNITSLPSESENNDPQLISNTDPATSTKPQTQQALLLAAIALVALLILAGIAAYYLYRNSTNRSSVALLPSPTSEPTNQVPSNTPETTSLPDGWRYQQSEACKVSVPIPPSTETYTGKELAEAGYAWSWNEVPDMRSTGLFNSEATVTLDYQGALDSGYVPGMVRIQCQPNTQNYTNQSLFEAVKSNYEQVMSSENGNYTAHTLGELEKWNQTVMEIKTDKLLNANNQDKEYLLATPSYIYSISKVSMSDDLLVQQTSQQILDLLQFTPLK